MFVDIGPIADKLLQLTSLYLEMRDVGVDIDAALYRAKQLKGQGKPYTVEDLLTEIDAARVVLHRERKT